VISHLSHVAAEEVSLNPCTVQQAVAARGEHSTFGFGRGIAIPHAPLSGLKQPVGFFTRVWPAQDFGAADGLLSDLAFLLLSPEGDDSTHLRALACVVRRLRDPEVAECLRSADDAEALYTLLTSDAWREPESGHSATPQANDLTNEATCTTLNVSC
jgi:PTS system nitrogen regulatory IIA component